MESMELLEANSKEAYGELIFQSRPNAARTVVRTLFAAIPGLFLVAATILPHSGWFGPPADDFEQFMPVFSGGFGVFYLLFVCVALIRQYSSDIFESGLVLKNGRKLTPLPFSDIEGVSYDIAKFKFFGVLPLPFNYRTFTIAVKNSRTPILLGPFRFRKFRDFTAIMEDTYSKYILKDITPANLNEQKLSFGANLRLEGGKLIFKGGERVVALKNISGLEMVRGHLMIYIPGEKSISINKTLNRSILFSLVELAKST
jgi:hypothetical protein